MSEDKKKQEGTTQTLNFQFGSVTVNGPMFDIHDNENVYINAEGRSSSSEQGRKTPPEPEKNGEGKRGQKKLLFRSEHDQAHWSQVFLDFLKEHNRASEQLTTSPDAYVNRALACFHKQWKKKGLLNDSAYDKAPSLFLFEDCAFSGVAERTYSNKVKEILAEAYRYEQANLKSNMMTEVEEAVEKNCR
jgi:hypothetical protein